MSQILILDDDSSIRRSFSSLMTKIGLKSIAAGTSAQALEIIDEGDVSLVFLDLKLPDMDGLEVLQRIKQIDENILVIIITGYATIESAIEAMRLGAYDYIKKPFKSDAIKLITKLALEKISLDRVVESLHLEKASRSPTGEMVGSCDAMVTIGKQIAKVARTDITLLIQGESGTGKELIAKMIHKESDRSSEPLIHLNCSAFPKDLLESEFFGYEKGAFTGAVDQKKGLIELANKGTLHLDEIGDMDLSLQAKLLRVLEERKFRRVGGTKELDVDIRIISSTNKDLSGKDLSGEIQKGGFRQDLYFRLSSFPIRVPPLRERGKDILLLAMYYLKMNNVRFNKRIQEISDGTKKILLEYSWPGNVRELKNIMERAMILAPEGATTLVSGDIPIDPLSCDQWESFSNFKNRFSRGALEFEDEISYEQIIHSVTNEIKEKLIDRALLLTDGNRTKAAKKLHLSRSALWREMEKIKRWQEKRRSDFEQ